MLPDRQKTQDKAAQLSLESFQCARNPSIHFPSHDATENTQGERISISSHYSKNFSPARPECPEGVYRRVAEKDKYALSAEALAKEEHYSATQKSIIAACKQPTSFDDIIMRTQLTSESVQNELFNLQLDGVVKQDFTGMWVAQ